MLMCLGSTGFAQSDTLKLKIPFQDTTYFKSYEDQVIGRFYFSQKYTSMHISNDDQHYDLVYQPNTTFNMGVGATYKFATLNIAIGFNFLNPDKGQGETKYLDLQFHSYGRKIMMDMFGQFYNGFYLSPKGKATDADSYYVRPDMFVMELGGSAQYVFNNKRFSYRSSFMQNEWQKKSAGSLLAGVEVFYGQTRFDSTAIPTVINPEVAAFNYTKMTFVEAGPNVGYAYTLVIKKHFFVHASLAISMDYGSTEIAGEGVTSNGNGFSPNTSIKMAAGYNSDLWIVNLLFTNSGVNMSTSGDNQQVGIDTGNFRIILAKRFVPGSKLKKKLKVIDNVGSK